METKTVWLLKANRGEHRLGPVPRGVPRPPSDLVQCSVLLRRRTDAIELILASWRTLVRIHGMVELAPAGILPLNLCWQSATGFLAEGRGAIEGNAMHGMRRAIFATRTIIRLHHDSPLRLSHNCLCEIEWLQNQHVVGRRFIKANPRHGRDGFDRGD